MGVDISGKNPIIRSPKHDYPNWNEISDKEKDAWFEMDEKWHNENPGDYFRSNWWGWRPIVMLCEFANDDYELGFDLIHWGSNDGAGLDNQEDCNKLADALEEIITTQTNLEEDVDTIYLNLGSWVSMDGKFLGDEVRVLKIGGDFSTELCGGTHVTNTSEIEGFIISNETSVSSGVRRIEAMTGSN